MLGDIFLQIKELIKKNFCIHDYSVKTRHINRQSFNIYTCKKCGYKKIK